MKVSLSWLTELVEIGLPLERLVERLTLGGLHVEGVEFVGGDEARRRLAAEGRFPGTPSEALSWEKVFVGQVVEVTPHPNADRLVLARVDYGRGQPFLAVTGAPNLQVGQTGLRVALAELGARLVNPYQGGTFKVEAAKLRGIASEAVICSEKELGLSDDHSAVLILEPDAPVGAPLVEVLGDAVLDIEIMPNMARCLSVAGLAREVAALTGAHLSLPKPESLTGSPAIQVTIQDPHGCPRWTGVLAKGVRIAPSPLWLRRRLLLSGVRPINNVVDITNYVMLEWGEPMHAFDRAKLSGDEIIVRRAHPGERMRTLDGQLRELRPQDLLICSAEGPVALAGVMGGEESQIGPETQDILFEAANFDPVSIRATAAEHRLPSESSYRFARGVDRELPPLAQARAMQLTRELAGATFAGYSDAYPLPWQPETLTLPLRDVQRLLGLDLPLEEVRGALERLEFQVTVEDGTLRAVPPSYRLDLEGPFDLVEEVARIVGYENIPLTLMDDEIPAHPPNPLWQAQETVRDLLMGAGLAEVVTYSLTNANLIARLRPDREPPDEDRYLRLANPISRERVLLRQELLAGIVEPLQTNLRQREGVAFFEIGRTYHPGPAGLPEERLRLSLALAGAVRPRHWGRAEPPRAGFYDLKGVVETLCDRLGVRAYEFRGSEHRSLHPSRRAALYIDGQHAGDLGELHPQVQANLDLPAEEVVVGELHLDKLLAARQPLLFQEVPRFPPVVEDLAVIVDKALPAAEVGRLLEEAGQPLLRSSRLFDVYEGPPIPEGKVSLAFSLTYQAADRTLTDQEVERVRGRIVKRLTQELGAELRA